MTIIRAMQTWLGIPKQFSLVFFTLVALMPLQVAATEQPDSDDWDVPNEDELMVRSECAR